MREIIDKKARQNTPMGKMFRNITSFKPVSKKRHGKCRRCGMCCKLVYECYFFSLKNNLPHCSIYPIRPPNCRTYPRTKEEFFTEEVCGFWFEE